MRPVIRRHLDRLSDNARAFFDNLDRRVAAGQGGKILKIIRNSTDAPDTLLGGSKRRSQVAYGVAVRFQGYD